MTSSRLPFLRRTGMALAAAVLLTPAAGSAAPVSFLEAFFHQSGVPDGLQAAEDAAVSPDGLFTYVVGRRDDAIAIFARDPADGTLTYLDHVLWDGDPGGTIPNMNRPVSLAISPDGAHMYVAAFNSDAVVVFSRDLGTGALTYVTSYVDTDPNSLSDPISLLRRAEAVAVSPDGEQVYVGSFDDLSPFDEAALGVYARNASTGELTPVAAYQLGSDGVDMLLRVHGITTSPDGANVYVASVGSAGILGDPAGVAVFQRNMDGTLTFLQSVLEGDPQISVLDNTRAVAVSPDGTSVYAVAGGNDTLGTPGGVTVFSRNPSTGVLSFVAGYSDASLSLEQPDGVKVTPSGDGVLVAAQGISNNDPTGHGLAVFQRSAATGDLILLQVLREGNGVMGVTGAFQVALSPDGTSAYVAGEQAIDPLNPPDPDKGGAVSVFAVPEAGAAASALGAGGALLALARRRQRPAASQSRGTRKTS
jgi:6-phosphogluconolactonase (cycloisomerase 2 family)